MVYLDNAATSYPKAPGVAEAMAECILHGAGGVDRSFGASAVAQAKSVFRTRTKLAQLLGSTDSGSIILTPGATFSLNLALQGVLGPGDHVVTTALEHNAVARPLTHLASTGVEITRVACPEGRAPAAEAFRDALRPNTRLVAVVHGSNVSGAVLPVADVAAVAHEAGVLVLVDAAQTVGAAPVDVAADALDMLAFPGHKGLLGPSGIGGLFMAPHVEALPLCRGGTGSRGFSAEHPDTRPDCYEPGTPNVPGIVGLGAACAYLLERGIDEIARHEARLIGHLAEGLHEVAGVDVYGPGPGEARAGLVSVNVNDLDPAEVGVRLERDYGIITRCGFHCSAWAHESLGTVDRGAVRLSVSPFTTEAEIETALRAIGEIAAASR